MQQQIRHMEIDDQAKKIQELNNTLHAPDEDKDDILRQPQIHDLMERLRRGWSGVDEGLVEGKEEVGAKAP